jgi:hypothetical protein
METKEWTNPEVVLEEGVKNAFGWTCLALGSRRTGGRVGWRKGGGDFGLI